MVLRGHIDFKTDPWPKLSDTCKDCVKRLLEQVGAFVGWPPQQVVVERLGSLQAEKMVHNDRGAHAHLACTPLR